MAVSGMRGASAEALAGLNEELRALDADLGVVGEELFGVAELLRAEPGLRRVATDVSTQGEAKAGLIRQLLDGKISEAALGLVGSAVQKRWTTTRDLADALEYLGVVAVVRSAGDAGRLSDELFEVGQLIAANADLRTALSDPARSRADKAGLLNGLLDGKALPATVRLADQALAGSYRTVSVALVEFQKIAATVHKESVAKVRVAQELSEADKQRLGEALSRQYGRPVHLNVVLEPDLIGGMRVEIGDDVIDGTVSSRLDDARRRLAG